MEKLRLNKAKYLGQVYYTNKGQRQNPHQLSNRVRETENQGVSHELLSQGKPSKGQDQTNIEFPLTEELSYS